MEKFNLEESLLMAFATKVFETDDQIVVTREPKKQKKVKAESSRSKTIKKAHKRMRFEKQLPDWSVPVNSEDRNYDMSHYGRFVNHARINHYVDREFWKPRKKDFRAELEQALADMA